jgi:predicted Zn-ribbon and HTH transcriptional regulator
MPTISAQRSFNSYTNTIEVLEYLKENKKWYYKLKCLTCNNIWNLRSDDLKRLVNNQKGGCRICSNKKISKSNIKPQIQEKLEKLNEYFEISKTNKYNIKHFKCKKCNIEFDDQPFNLIGKLDRNQYPCIQCKYELINNSIENQEKQLLENDILDIKVLNRITTAISRVVCLNCNYEWESYFGNIIRAKRKWNTNSCPECDRLTGRTTSSQQIDLENFVKQYYKIVVGYKLSNGQEIDIFIPELNLGIEYNGSYYHSPDTGIRIDDKYHLNKTKIANESNIKLIHIFSPYWIHKKELCKSKLLNILKQNKLFLRSNQYTVKSIPWKFASIYLNNNHIMGAGENPLFSYGLYDKLNLLVGVATFTNKRKGNFRERDDEIVEFNRFATSIRCYGSMQKILNHVKKYHPYLKQIISYADLCWSDIENNIYSKNGFQLEKITDPNYWWCKNDILIPRRNAMKQNLSKLLGDRFDPNKTEIANMLLNGYIRIWDCGHAKYILNL